MQKRICWILFLVRFTQINIQNIISRFNLSGLVTVAAPMPAVCQEPPSALLIQQQALWTVAMIVVLLKCVSIKAVSYLFWIIYMHIRPASFSYQMYLFWREFWNIPITIMCCTQAHLLDQGLGWGPGPGQGMRLFVFTL